MKFYMLGRKDSLMLCKEYQQKTKCVLIKLTKDECFV